MQIFEGQKPVSDQELTLLPPYTRIFGAVTQARIFRLLGLYALLALSGSILVFLSQQAFLQTFGLGLILPGGGFLADYDLTSQNGFEHLVAALVTIMLFVIALGIWFGTGNILAPPTVWLGAALWAASLGSSEVSNKTIAGVYALVGLILLASAMILSIRFGLARNQRRIDNAYLLSQQDRIETLLTSTTSNEFPEMSLEDLQRLRFALDRALQAIAEFNGFEWLDQFQTAAVRYQVNFLAYGIAMSQTRFTPAFGGYLHEAQINLLDKQADYKVWSYWGLENLWGNLSRNPDPLARENIMYTGFVALQMALFKASTGRGDFSRKDRFKLLHPSGKQYAYHDADLVERLEKEYQVSAFFLIACEPNWIYPLCNTIGASAILAYDALKQQTKWKQYEQDFRQHLEAEFLDAFGRYVPCRSARTGLALPVFGGAMPLAMPCFFLNAIFPDLAVRQWLLLRRRLFDKKGSFRRNAFWRIDTGNYGFSRASAYTATALAAAELGDQEVYQQCLQALEDECPSVLKDGVIHRQQASVWAHGVEMMARAVTQNGFRDLLLHPRKPTGPRLEGLIYPDVLVASAHVDKEGLKAVLYPGLSNGIYEMGLTGLKPQGCYRVSGAMMAIIEANTHGEARFSVQLNGRTSVNIYPEEKF